MKQQKHIFDKMDLSGTRQPGESFVRYKKRRKQNRMLVRRYLWGRLVWDGAWGQAEQGADEMSELRSEREVLVEQASGRR
jgi:hypothetical protein